MFWHKKIVEKKNVATIIIAFVIVAAAALWVFCKGSFVAGRVDGSFISRAAFERELEKQAGGRRVLDSMITETLIENELKKKGVAVAVSDEEVSAGVTKLETNIAAQGSTMKDFLEQQGMSAADLEKRIRTQKGVEKLLADKVKVTDEEVAKYMADNRAMLPKTDPEALKTQVRDQLRGQKLNEEIEKWITELKSQAKIEYYLGY